MENTSTWQDTLMRSALSLAIWFIPLLFALQVCKDMASFRTPNFSDVTTSFARVVAAPAYAATTDETLPRMEPVMPSVSTPVIENPSNLSGSDQEEPLPSVNFQKPLPKPANLVPPKDKINYVKEIQCLAQAIYYEARSESLTGQLAVAEVVLNRVKSGQFEDSICGVVYQRTAQVCQFSFVCDGSMKDPLDQEAWLSAQKMALGIMKGKNRDKIREVTGKATHYHANYVKPNWASAMKKTTVIGNHIFYRDLPSSRMAQN